MTTINLQAAGVSPKWLNSERQKGHEVGPLRDSSRLREAAEKLVSDVKALHDTTFVPFFFDFDEEGNDEKFLKLMGSRKWTGIALGGGLRTIPHLSEYFTKTVNLLIAEQPQAKLIFPLVPTDVVPQLKRFIPELA